MPESRRRLPHIYPEGKWIFLTWHLHGSIPQAMYPPPHKLSAGQAFVYIDRYLDSARSGPTYLRREPIAGLVIEALNYGVSLGNYDLGPYVVMANHVHLLLLPKIPLPKIMRSLKGATARQSNLILARTGEPFWQSESYDHWVRDENEWNRIANYIEENPVHAGLAQRPEDYHWSSAFERAKHAETNLGAADRNVRATE